jgi:hypothetical protein
VSSLISTEEGRKRLQQALVDNGYDIGPDGVDGYLGGNTARAIINARIANKLSHQDQAVVDTDLERVLGLLTIQSPAVKATGNFILTLGLQYLLNRLPKGPFPMLSTIDKAWVAGVVAFACQYIVNHFFNITVSADTQSLIVTVIVALITAVATWIVPNKPKS